MIAYHSFIYEPLLHLDAYVEFVDVSVVELRGTISIANTAEYNEDSGYPCPISGATVCAQIYMTTIHLGCATSATDGMMQSIY
jgi:hypothetical protein